MKYTLIIALLFIGINGYAQKQSPVKKRFNSLTKILENNYVDENPKKLDIVVFSNVKCGRCQRVTKDLKKDKVSFIEFDLKIQKNATIMRKLCYKKEGRSNISIMYPVVIVEDKVYHSIKNLTNFLKKLKDSYKANSNKL